MKILLTEDDTFLGDAIAERLRKNGYAVDTAPSLAAMDRQLSANTYDCIVLDRTLPDGDSLEHLSTLRNRGLEAPTLFLSARDSVADRLDGFEAGADDYLVKPFAFQELLARIRALVRRHSDTQPVVATVGGITMDSGRHTVTRKNMPVNLTAKEFAVLETLVRRPDTVVTRSTIIESCWDELTDPLSNVVDVTMWQLRRKLGSPNPIETIRGVGYRLHA